MKGLFGWFRKGKKKNGINVVNRIEHQNYIRALAGMSERERERIIEKKGPGEQAVLRFQVQEFRRYGFLPYVSGGPRA